MFVFYFDIAAIIITVLIGILNLLKKELKNTSYYILNTEIVLIIITPIADIISIKAIYADWPTFVFELSNTVFYLTQLLIAILFLQFILSKRIFKDSLKRIYRILISIPAMAYIFLILTNQMTNLAWTFINKENLYVHGPAFMVLIGIPVFYFLLTYVFILFSQGSYSLFIKLTMNVALLLIFITIVLEVVFKNIMLHSFGFSLALVLMYVCVMSSNASVDEQSEMPNIFYYVEYINKLLFTKRPFAINFIRIADYDLYLNTYGHVMTEKLMVEIEKCFTGEFEIGEIYEIQSNYYALITTKVEDIDLYQERAKRILDQNWKIEGIELAFSYFIVGLVYPNDVKNFDDIMSYGHYIERMHRKRYGVVPIQELALRDTVRETSIERAIERAIKSDGFEVYYQPIYSIKEKKFTSAEALIRLNDKILGAISPAEFIPISEKNGSIIKIGNFVMDSVFKFLSEHDCEYLGIEYIELNLSVIQCLQRNFMDILYNNLKNYSVDPHQICFEITETASNCAPEVFEENLTKLNKGGYKLAIDDYGTGYANFNRLIDGQFSIVKFDKDTVEQVCYQTDKEEVFSKLVNITHAIGYKIVAEGVETDSQKEFLEKIGVDYIQGYYYSKALSLNEYIDFLHKNNITKV